MKDFLLLIDRMINENGGTIDYDDRGLNTQDLLRLLEKVRYLRTNDGSEFRKFDFSAFELGQIRSMIECWLEDIKKYPPEGEFTIISAGHSVNDLFELKRLVNGE